MKSAEKPVTVDVFVYEANTLAKFENRDGSFWIEDADTENEYPGTNKTTLNVSVGQRHRMPVLCLRGGRRIYSYMLLTIYEVTDSAIYAESRNQKRFIFERGKDKEGFVQEEIHNSNDLWMKWRIQ
jgi:hypothetical protein